ncbi:cytidine deaminase 1-like [Actinidia eriantha]|uniref:cytidine deaminase 1-like n=1 Tax=Actinidia eriantha TaxID=165200 RepID=UPI00258F66C8|nr:cytidine deaminase 1-like [Actinidia eriantha]
MEGSGFVIEASEAESMARKSGLSLVQLLPTLVGPAQTLARPPISNYHVGAAGLGSDGRIFLGVNLEFSGVPLHHSVHAEQFLVTNLTAAGVPRLLAFAVSSAPCGHCRQFLQELRNASYLQICITDQQDTKPNSNFIPLSSILPNPFGPFDLLDNETPLLLERHHNGLSLLSVSNTKIPNGITNLCNGNCRLLEKNEFELEIAALEAANNSHAPYSGCPSGVALRDSEGRIYKGSYMESAAYNPSLGPVQAALVAFVASGGGGYEGIVGGVLVEREGAAVRQEDTARLLLKMISPKCDFGVVHCVSASNGCKRDSSNGCE